MKRCSFLLILVIVVMLFNKDNQNVDVPMLSEEVKPVGQYVPKKYPPVPEQVRAPAATKKREKRKLDRTFSSLKKDPSIKIGKSYELMADMATLPREKYLPEMGKKISEDKHHIFFHPASRIPDALPVALNPSQQKFYPVSPVLHVRGIDQAGRNQLKSEGMREFYYHARMKLLSLETSPSTVLSHYQTLLKRGFDVRLEILKDPPKAK